MQRDVIEVAGDSLPAVKGDVVREKRRPTILLYLPNKLMFLKIVKSEISSSF